MHVSMNFWSACNSHPASPSPLLFSLCFHLAVYSSVSDWCLELIVTFRVRDFQWGKESEESLGRTLSSFVLLSVWARAANCVPFRRYLQILRRVGERFMLHILDKIN
jgi:hypothetical protein